MRSLLAGISLLVLSGTAVAIADTNNAVTAQLAEQNGSGEMGTATLTQVGKDVQVEIALTGASASAQPAHIHAGTCSNLTKAPKYPLNDVVNGESTTTLKDVDLSSLTASPFGVNVHKSAAEIKTPVACGDIK